MVALAWVDRSSTGRVPLVGIVVVTALLIVSVMMFISLIQRVSMLQVARMLVFTGDHGREIIESLYPPLDTPASPSSIEVSDVPILQTLVHHGHPLMVQAVDVPALVRIAAEAGAVVELTVTVGDSVLESTPILKVRGGVAPVPEPILRNAIDLGGERTFEQDPKYAIRLLVDIAIKALSPAINDPTTAVQALDQIEDHVGSTGAPPFGDRCVS